MKKPFVRAALLRASTAAHAGNPDKALRISRGAVSIHPAFSSRGLNYKTAIAIPFGLVTPL